jgi:hypothetical protein
MQKKIMGYFNAKPLLILRRGKTARATYTVTPKLALRDSDQFSSR